MCCFCSSSSSQSDKLKHILKFWLDHRSFEIERSEQVCPNGSLDREGIEQLYAMPRRLIIAMILIIAKMGIIAKMLIIKKMLVITKMLISTIPLEITIYDGLTFVLHRNAKVFIDQMFRLFDRDGNGKIGFKVTSMFCLLI